MAFDELELLPVRIEPRRQYDCDGEHAHRDDEAGAFRVPAGPGWEDRDYPCTGERHQPQQTQPRDLAHHRLTTITNATTRVAPTNIDSAYERANPVWVRRTEVEASATAAAMASTAPS